MNMADPDVRVVQMRIGRRAFVFSLHSYLLLLGLCIGLVTGGIAVLFRLAAIYGEMLFLPHSALLGQDGLVLLRRLLMPALGGLVVGLLLYRVSNYKSGHSLPHILRDLASGQTNVNSRLVVPPLLSVLTIASGNSTGVEGPIAELGSILGNLMGRIIHAPPRLMKTLMGAGVAAGISAVFNAPIGGVFFAIEVIMRNFELSALTPIVVAAVVASVISQLALGQHAAIGFPQVLHVSLSELPAFALLGLLCGLLAMACIVTLSCVRRQFRKLSLPLWVKTTLGGLGVGIIGLGMPQAMGEGYSWVREFLATPAMPVLLAALLIFKIIATALTLGSGNPGGTFAPAVMLGAILGSLFGQGMVALGWASSPVAYAIVGMAGMIAAALGAPLTGMMIILHGGGHDSAPLLLPLMCTVALAAFVMQRWRRGNFYTYELICEGFDLDAIASMDPVERIKVSAVMRTDPWLWLEASLPLEDALHACKQADERWFLVRQEARGYLGTLAMHDLRLAISNPELGHLLTLHDIVEPSYLHLTPTMNLVEAMNLFRETSAEVLPVFAPGRPRPEVIGVITRQTVLDAFLDSR